MAIIIGEKLVGRVKMKLQKMTLKYLHQTKPLFHFIIVEIY